MNWAKKLRMYLTAGIIFMIGISMLVISWVIGVIECIHLTRHEHQFQLTPFVFAFLGMTGGGLVIQTGSLVFAAKKLKEMTRGLPGGRRWYDSREQSTKGDE